MSGITRMVSETAYKPPGTENGQKDTEWNFKDGEQDGLTTGWYENGQKDGEWNYKDGEQDGLDNLVARERSEES